MFNFRGGTEKKSMYLILIHMAFTNMIMLFSKETLKITTAFGLRNFLNDTGHKKECRVHEDVVHCWSCLGFSVH
jgi:vomeronasal1 receptor